MKVGFVSLGCPKNLVDSEVMMGQLVQSGHELTNDPATADVIVVNTCSFIDPAKQESVDTIIEMGKFKTQGQAKKLIVAGCLVERFKGDIRDQLPEVDHLIGTNELDKIVPIVNGQDASAPSNDPYLYHDLTPRILATPRHSAYIKISEGCDHPCTFCVIPHYRGAMRSRRFESVVVEANRLLQQGIREINLIGQDTTSYGQDLGLKDGLATLMERLAKLDSPHDYWVRVLYVYPNRVTQQLLDTLAAHPRLCKYIDIPLQHASSNVLKRMKRGSNGDFFLQLLERIRKTIPHVTVRTSMIVGFPGETDADFQELKQFVEAGQFDRLGVFSYSDEDTSKSFALDGKVDARTIYNRKRSLMAVQKKISQRLLKKMVGREFKVLLEGPSAETELLWEARHQGQAPEIDGVCYVNDFGDSAPKTGQFRTLRVTEAHDHDVVGELIDQAPSDTPEFSSNPFPIISGHKRIMPSQHQ
jgi:ribosomal protein S12 methylthiotransferase